MQPQQLNYQPPRDDARQTPFPFSVAGLIGGFFVSITFFTITVVTAKFTEIFRDFNVSLPLITCLLVDATRALANLYYLPLLGIPLVCAFTFPWLGRSKQSKTTERLLLRWGVGVMILFLFTAVTLAFVVLALFMPMTSLIEGMSGGAKR